MYRSALSIYYGLAIFVVGAGFFVMQPTDIPEMKAWQDGVKLQFATAFTQTVGYQPWISDYALIYYSVNNFYKQASNPTIAILTPHESDQDLIYVFHEV